MSDDWQTPVTIRPIGVVESVIKTFDQIPTYHEEAFIRIREDLRPGLIGVEHFSHMHIIYRQHLREAWKRRAFIPEGTEQLTSPLAGEPNCMGIYTSRSPARPSGMGSCIVEILGREPEGLRVKGLDAVDGTPVLDMKIYIPQYDSFPDAVTPLHWCFKSKLVDTSKRLRWDTINTSLTLGMRVGQRILRELDVSRGGADHATVQGGSFFAQGVEAVSGCSVLHDTMTFIDKPKSLADWLVVAEGNGRRVTIQVRDQLHAGADDVLSLADEHLFESVKTIEVAS